jgi:hypothetical protein
LNSFWSPRSSRTTLSAKSRDLAPDQRVGTFMLHLLWINPSSIAVLTFIHDFLCCAEHPTRHCIGSVQSYKRLELRCNRELRPNVILYVLQYHAEGSNARSDRNAGTSWKKLFLFDLFHLISLFPCFLFCCQLLLSKLFSYFSPQAT